MTAADDYAGAVAFWARLRSLEERLAEVRAEIDRLPGDVDKHEMLCELNDIADIAHNLRAAS